MAMKQQSDEKRPNNDSIIEKEVVLRRELGLPGAVGMSMGSVIGSGIFVMPRGTAIGGGSVALTLIMWALGGTFSAFGAIGTAELATMIPKSGGPYNYLKAAYGRWVGFVYTWKQVVLGGSSSQAIMAMTFSKYVMSPLFQDGCGEAPEIITKLLAVLVLVVVAALNCISVKWAAKVHVMATSGKVMALLMIIIGGIVMICKGHTAHLSTGFTNTTSDPMVISLGFYSCMFAYDGWENITVVVEEVKNPSKNVPRTLGITTVLVTLLYIMTNVSYFAVMSVDELCTSPAVGVTWANRVMPEVTWIISLCVCVSTFGAINSSIMACSRYHFVLARENIWPGFLSMINVKRYTPVPSVLITVAFSLMYVFLSDIAGLIKYSAFVKFLGFALKMVALFILRRSMKNSPRPFKTNLLFPALYGLFVFALFIVPLVGRPQIEFLFASLMVAAGLIFYAIFVKCERQITVMDKMVCFIQLWLQVSPQSTNTFNQN